jgi:hypothetical protein
MGARTYLKVYVGFRYFHLPKEYCRHIVVVVLTGMDKAFMYRVAILTAANKPRNDCRLDELWPRPHYGQ